MRIRDGRETAFVLLDIPPPRHEEETSYSKSDRREYGQPITPLLERTINVDGRDIKVPTTFLSWPRKSSARMSLNSNGIYLYIHMAMAYRDNIFYFIINI